MSYRTRRLAPLAILLVTASVRIDAGDALGGLDRLRAGRSRRASSADANWKNGNGDARPIEPGQTRTIAELEGPGRITHIWFTIAAADPFYGRSVTLRMYWDGSKEPAVECPLGDFFAAGHGIRVPISSLPVQVSSEGRAYNCYWPMPFRRSAKITVSNDSTTHRVNALFWYVDWTQLPSLPEDTACFHAQYRQEFPCASGRDYLILDAEGRGHYVGTVLSVHANEASWFGEGDDRFFIDGEKEPSLRGTGTEDYFCDAWGFRQFTHPSYGVSIWEGFEVDDHGTAYRWHIQDPVNFEKSLRVTIEHKGVTFFPDGRIRSGFEERPDNLSSVAFWYQTGKARRFATLPPASERLVQGTTIEAETLVSTARATPAGLEAQDGGYSGGKQLFYHPPAGDTAPSLELDFSIPETGRYALKTWLTHSWDYGVWRVDLDGETVLSGVDLWSSTISTDLHKLGVRRLEKGKHRLSFHYLRSHPESRVRGDGSVGRYLGVDRIYFRRVPERK